MYIGNKKCYSDHFEKSYLTHILYIVVVVVVVVGRRVPSWHESE